MEQEQLHLGQRIRVTVPGIGDHGQLGTIKKMQASRCYVHLDWDPQPQHVVLFYAADLEGEPIEAAPAR